MSNGAERSEGSAQAGSIRTRPTKGGAAICRVGPSIGPIQTPQSLLDDFLPFHERIAHAGMWNSLAQVVLKITAPGIPDFYQGSELWDFSVVDPDNRRPVDHTMRASMLADLQRARAECGTELRRLTCTLLEHPMDGRIKLYTTMMALNFDAPIARSFRTESTYL